MLNIAIPKELIKSKQLVAVTLGDYERFLAWQKKIKSVKTFRPSATEKNALAHARANRAKGTSMTVETLEHELGLDR